MADRPIRTARIAAILVTINPAYQAAELRHALNKAGVSLLFTARGFRDADYLAMLDQARADCPDLRQIVVLDDEWESFLAESARAEPRRLTEREATLDPSDAVNIQYTSGTTGLSKGATLSHRNILNNGHFTAEVLRYAEHDRVCVPVPFYHCFGMVLGNLAVMTHGACVVARRVVRRPRRPHRCGGRTVHVTVRRPDHVHRPACGTRSRNV